MELPARPISVTEAELIALADEARRVAADAIARLLVTAREVEQVDVDLAASHLTSLADDRSTTEGLEFLAAAMLMRAAASAIGDENLRDA